MKKVFLILSMLSMFTFFACKAGDSNCSDNNGYENCIIDIEDDQYEIDSYSLVKDDNSDYIVSFKLSTDLSAFLEEYKDFGSEGYFVGFLGASIYENEDKYSTYDSELRFIYSSEIYIDNNKNSSSIENGKLFFQFEYNLGKKIPYLIRADFQHRRFDMTTESFENKHPSIVKAYKDLMNYIIENADIFYIDDVPEGFQEMHFEFSEEGLNGYFSLDYSNSGWNDIVIRNSAIKVTYADNYIYDNYNSNYSNYESYLLSNLYNIRFEYEEESVDYKALSYCLRITL